MRKFTLIICLGMIYFSAQAQISFEASKEYGKVWGITYDSAVPNKLYALTLVNHLMVSTDNGTNWNILFTFPNSSVYLGVLKMVPGGKALSFTVTGNADLTLNGLYIFDLATYSVSKHFYLPNYTYNPSIISYDIYNAGATNMLVQTSYSNESGLPVSKVYYTPNSGTTWNEVYSSDAYSTTQINNVAISPADSTKLFLMRGFGAGGINGGLFISVNSGASWIQQLDNITLDPVTFNPHNANELFIGTGINTNFSPDDEGLYHSTDGGNTFTQVPITFTGQQYANNNVTKLKYDTANTNIIWMLEDNEIGKSTDGGQTWKMSVFSADNTTYDYGTNITINPVNDNEVFINSDGWPQHSTDGGNTLTQMKNPFCVIDGIVYGNYTSSQHLYYSSQAGYMDKDLATGVTTAYQVQSPFTVSISSQVKTIFADSTVAGRMFIYMAGDGFSTNSSLSYSDDYGATTSSLPCDQFSNAISFVEKDPNTPNQYWTSFSSFGSSPTLFKLNMNDPANAFATPVTTPDAANVITALTVSAYSPDVLYLSQGVFVYKSIDGGQSWTPNSKGLGILTDGTDAIRDLKNNPLDRNQFMIATSQGIFVSNDSAQKWTLKMPGTNVKKLSFSPFVNGQVIAGTYSNYGTETQLYYTTDGASNWKTVSPTNLDYLQISAMDFKWNPNAVDIYFGTTDLGIVKFPLSNLLTPLPLQLLAFNGQVKNNNAALLWKTTNEINLQQYQVERSTAAQNFEKIGMVTAANTSGDNSYTYEDRDFSVAALTTGAVYYRLK